MMKQLSRFSALFLLVSAVALAGAGCSDTLPSMEPAGPKKSNLEGLSPADAANKVNLVPGSVIETRQTFLGFGAKLAAKLAGENKEGTRRIVISRFAPGETANVEWKLVTMVEEESSIKTREAARKAGKPEPEPVMVESASQGGVNGFNLKDSHTLYLPAFWPDMPNSTSLGTSGVWLSSVVYEGLERNRVASLDFGILDTNLQGAVGKIVEFRDALRALQNQKTKIENRTDVFKLDGEKEVVEWPLIVNGKEVKVAAIKARSWFGEIVVLQNKQNPLILKATLNPMTGGVAEVFSGLPVLKALLGYEVTEIVDAQE